MGVRLAICARTQGSCMKAHALTVILDRCTPHIWVIFSSTEYPGKWKYSHLEGLTFDAVYVVTGMNAPGAISLTPLKISCPFHGLLLPPRMHTQGELISS